MIMIMTKTLTVNGIANQETTERILTSTSENHWHINRLWVTEVTATLQNDAILRAYRDLYLITDFAYKHLTADDTTTTRSQLPVINIDVDLPAGSDFYVGIVSGGTASDIQFTVEYEESKGA